MLALVGCASTPAAPPSPELRERARQRVLQGKSCPEKHIVTEDGERLRFLVAGCGHLMYVRAECDDKQCRTIGESSTLMAHPKRLTTKDGKLWFDPTPAPPAPEPIEVQQTEPAGDGASPASANANKVGRVGVGRRVSDVSLPQHKPMLPKELNRAGMVVWGLYKICVSAAGDVRSIKIIKSALPGGLDADWISKMETWKYESYSIDGKRVPFCHPARVEVRSTS